MLMVNSKKTKKLVKKMGDHHKPPETIHHSSLVFIHYNKKSPNCYGDFKVKVIGFDIIIITKKTLTCNQSKCFCQ
ncbi:hypothetical protein [Dolichospermum phage Dfl-JY23]